MTARRAPTARAAARSIAADQGCVTSRDLADETGCSRPVASSTLARLAREGWLRRDGKARYVCAMPITFRVPDVNARIEAAVLLSRGAASANQIAMRAGHGCSTTLRHLRELRRIGRVRETMIGWEAA